MLIDPLVTGSAVALMCAVAIGLGYLAMRNSAAMVALLLAVWIATAGVRDTIDLSVTLSGVRITALDLTSLVLVIVALVRILTDGVRTVPRSLALVLLMLIGLHIARGISVSGFQTAFNDTRGWFYFSSALLYAATMPMGGDRRIWRVLVLGGVILSLVALYYFATGDTGSATQVTFRDGEWVSSRPLTAAGALLVLQAAIIALALRWPSRQLALVGATGGALIVLFLQHRTVWAAAVIVGVVGFIWWSTRNVRRSQSTVFAFTGLLLLALPIAVWGFSQSGPLVESTKEVTSSHSTLVWRTESWGELLSSHDALANVAIGQPAGASFDRLINGQIVDVSPHDGLVDAYIRFGLPGTLVLLWLGFFIWRRRQQIGDAVGLPADMIALLILTQLCFSFAYSLDALQGIITGTIAAGFVARDSAKREAPAQSVPSPEYAFR